MKRRIFLCLLICACILPSCFIFAGCFEHSHVFTDWQVIQELSCEQDEILERHCIDCAYIEKINGATAPGHSFGEWHQTRAATCYREGEKQSECELCHQILSQPISKTAHSYGSWNVTKNATCNTAGQKQRVCTVSACRHTITEEIPKIAHVMETKRVEPTCTEPGLQTEECKYCSYIKTKTTLPATGHSFGAWTTTIEATCTTNGQQKRTCGKCKKIETQIIPASGSHELVTTTTPASCTSNGKTVEQCKNCSYNKTTTLYAKGHSYGSWITTVTGTCTTNGQQKRICNTCGNVETQTITGSGNHDIQTNTTPATCTTNGKIEETCKKCSYKKTTTINATGHNIQKLTTPATCTKNGFENETCIKCGLVTSSKTLYATGHVESDWIIDTNATCSSAGIRHKQCTKCSQLMVTEDIPKTDHDYTYSTTVKNPTVSKLGYTQHECSCGKYYQDTFTCLITLESMGYRDTYPKLPSKTSVTVNQNAIFEGISNPAGFYVQEYRIYNGTNYSRVYEDSYVVSNSTTIHVVYKNQTEIDFETLIDKITKLEEISKAYNSSNYQIRAMQYIRNSRYGTGTWNSFGGTLEGDVTLDDGSVREGFTTYVKNNQGSYNLASLQTLSSITIPSTNEKVDFVHMIAIMNVIAKKGLSDSTSNDMVGWGGDLCQLVQQLSKLNLSGTALQTKADELLGGSSATSTFSSDDLLADLDALNAMHVYNSLTTKSLATALSQYYNTLTSQGRKDQVITNSDKAAFSSIIVTDGSKTVEKMADEIVSRLSGNGTIWIWCFKEGISFSSDAEEFKAAAVSLVNFLIKLIN